MRQIRMGDYTRLGKTTAQAIPATVLPHSGR